MAVLAVLASCASKPKPIPKPVSTTLPIEAACLESGAPFERCFPGGVHHLILKPQTSPTIAELATPQRAVSVVCDAPERRWTAGTNVLLSCSREGTIDIYKVPPEIMEFPNEAGQVTQEKSSNSAPPGVIALDGIAHRIIDTRSMYARGQYVRSYGALAPVEPYSYGERPLPVTQLNCLLNSEPSEREERCSVSLLTETSLGNCELTLRAATEFTLCDVDAIRSYRLAGSVRNPTPWGSDLQIDCITRTFREHAYSGFGHCGALGSVSLQLPTNHTNAGFAIELADGTAPALTTCDGRAHQTFDGFAICDGERSAIIFLEPTATSPILNALSRKLDEPSAFAGFGFGTVFLDDGDTVHRRAIAYQQGRNFPPISVIAQVVDIVGWEAFPACEDPAVVPRVGPPGQHWDKPQCRIVARGELHAPAVFAEARAVGISFGSRAPARETAPCDGKRHMTGPLYLTCDRARLIVEVTDLPANATEPALEAAFSRTFHELLLVDALARERDLLPAILTVERADKRREIPLRVEARRATTFRLSIASSED